jgi:hypothetical protein
VLVGGIAYGRSATLRLRLFVASDAAQLAAAMTDASLDVSLGRVDICVDATERQKGVRDDAPTGAAAPMTSGAE